MSFFHGVLEAFIVEALDHIVVIVFILQESVVALSVSSCHLHASDISMISHVADSSCLNYIQEILVICLSVTKEKLVSQLRIRLHLSLLEVWMVQKCLNKF